MKNDRFTADTAERTGRPERSIQRDAARGKSLGDDLTRIAGTSLDKGVELDALAKMKPEQREPLIRRARDGEAVSARSPEAVRGRPEPRKAETLRVRDGRPIEIVPVDELHAIAEALEGELNAVRAEIARRADGRAR